MDSEDHPTQKESQGCQVGFNKLTPLPRRSLHSSWAYLKIVTAIELLKKSIQHSCGISPLWIEPICFLVVLFTLFIDPIFWLKSFLKISINGVVIFMSPYIKRSMMSGCPTFLMTKLISRSRWWHFYLFTVKFSNLLLLKYIYKPLMTIAWSSYFIRSFKLVILLFSYSFWIY